MDLAAGFFHIYADSDSDDAFASLSKHSLRLIAAGHGEATR